MKPGQTTKESKDFEIVVSIFIALCFVGGGWFLCASQLGDSSIRFDSASYSWMSTMRLTR